MTTRTTTLRKCALLLGAAVSIATLGENSSADYRWAYHPQYGYTRVGLDNAYGYGGLGAGTTAAEGAGIGAGAAAAGRGQEAADIGQYQVEHQQAEEIHQQAVKQYYQNEGIARENYEQQQQTQQQEVSAEEAAARQSHADYEAKLHQMTAAHRLTADQFDRANGILQWPYVLRSDEFSDLRTKIDHLYAERTPDNSGTDSSSYEQIEQACDAMIAIINSEAGKLGIEEFITAKHFAQSVAYEASFKVTGNGSGAATTASN